jgi:hypothetical protein
MKEVYKNPTLSASNLPYVDPYLVSDISSLTSSLFLLQLILLHIRDLIYRIFKILVVSTRSVQKMMQFDA